MAETASSTRGLLSSVRLLSAKSGESVNLRSSRSSRVLVALHSIHCTECIAYLESVMQHAGEIADWNGRMHAVIPGPAGTAAAFSMPTARNFETLLDPDRQVANGEQVGVIVADQWGEVYFAAQCSDSHALPGAEEIVEWTRFIAIQCPECGVPDAAWASVKRTG